MGGRSEAVAFENYLASMVCASMTRFFQSLAGLMTPDTVNKLIDVGLHLFQGRHLADVDEGDPVA